MRTWRAAERLRAHRCGNCKIEFLTATMCSCIRPLRCLPPCSFTTEPVPRKFSAHNKIDLRSWTDARGGIQNCVQNARWVATTEALLPLNASTAKALCTFDLAMTATADSNYYRGTGVGTEWENFLLHFAEYHFEFYPFLTERLWKSGSYFSTPCTNVPTPQLWSFIRTSSFEPLSQLVPADPRVDLVVGFERIPLKKQRISWFSQKQF